MRFLMPLKMVRTQVNSNLSSLRLAALLLLAVALPSHASLLLFAAASTTDVMQALGTAYAETNGERVRFSFASSGILARQIEAGAAADIFVSANTAWMDWLEGKAMVRAGSRFNLVANTLVMVAPLGTTVAFDGNWSGRLAVGDVKSTPAGIYAEEALRRMGWLERIRPQLVMSGNARSTLRIVERGEVTAGIVYATDAQASEKVTVIGQFPPTCHHPILYPVAACSDKSAARPFLEFLRSPEARAILIEHGFIVPPTT